MSCRDPSRRASTAPDRPSRTRRPAALDDLVDSVQSTQFELELCSFTTNRSIWLLPGQSQQHCTSPSVPRSGCHPGGMGVAEAGRRSRANDVRFYQMVGGVRHAERETRFCRCGISQFRDLAAGRRCPHRRWPVRSSCPVRTPAPTQGPREPTPGASSSSWWGRDGVLL